VAGDSRNLKQNIMGIKTNRQWLIPITDEDMSSVISILQEPIMETLKVNVLLKQLEIGGGMYSLDFISDKLTTAHIVALLDSGKVIERVKYFIELKPALATVDTPEMFPSRTVATEWDEQGNATATRVLKINEYFWNQTVGGRFFIRLAKAPIDANSNIDSHELPNSEQVKQFIIDYEAHILNYYSQMEYNELVSELNVIEE